MKRVFKYRPGRYQFLLVLLYSTCLTIDIEIYKSFCFNFPELYKQPGRVAVITGGNRGIGLRIVEKLLACDMTVLMGKSHDIQQLDCYKIINYIAYLLQNCHNSKNMILELMMQNYTRCQVLYSVKTSIPLLFST